MSLNPFAKVGETFKDEVGNSCLTLPFGNSTPYDTEDDYVSKLLFFGPMISKLVDTGKDVMCAAMGIVGTLGWGNSRRAKRFLQQAERAIAKHEDAVNGAAEEGGSGMPKIMWSGSLAYDEAADEQAKSWEAKFMQGAKNMIG